MVEIAAAVVVVEIAAAAVVVVVEIAAAAAAEAISCWSSCINSLSGRTSTSGSRGSSRLYEIV